MHEASGIYKYVFVFLLMMFVLVCRSDSRRWRTVILLEEVKDGAHVIVLVFFWCKCQAQNPLNIFFARKCSCFIPVISTSLKICQQLFVVALNFCKNIPFWNPFLCSLWRVLFHPKMMTSPAILCITEVSIRFANAKAAEVKSGSHGIFSQVFLYLEGGAQGDGIKMVIKCRINCVLAMVYGGHMASLTGWKGKLSIAWWEMMEEAIRDKAWWIFDGRNSMILVLLHKTCTFTLHILVPVHDLFLSII